jgi:sensor histidine kinase YesM
MMERIHTLVMEMKGMEAKKKHLELGILQSQIAPHFLYNTLACISSLARQKRIDDVRETIRSLVGLLSFSFNRTSEYVTLEEELECLKRYVHIQQIRYGEQFELELLVAPQALSCRMLKLTLQPLVENAIFHGIVPTKVKGCIRVRGRIVQGMLKLYIVDDGLGMERERCQTLLEKRDKPASSGSFTGMGVMNVHERLLIHFGQPSGLTVRSCPGKGTVVRVTLPFQEWNAAPLEKDVS